VGVLQPSADAVVGGDELPDLRWSLLVASLLFTSYLFHGKTIFRREIFRHKSTQWLLILSRDYVRP
jgi:hypothetical protein